MGLGENRTLPNVFQVQIDIQSSAHQLITVSNARVHRFGPRPERNWTITS